MMQFQKRKKKCYGVGNSIAEPTRMVILEPIKKRMVIPFQNQQRRGVGVILEPSKKMGNQQKKMVILLNRSYVSLDFVGCFYFLKNLD